MNVTEPCGEMNADTERRQPGVSTFGGEYVIIY
jgi:hypothetical protein